MAWAGVMIGNVVAGGLAINVDSAQFRRLDTDVLG